MQGIDIARQIEISEEMAYERANSIPKGSQQSYTAINETFVNILRMINSKII